MTRELPVGSPPAHTRVSELDGHVTGQEQEFLRNGLGARLMFLRLDAKLSRARLAEAAGIAPATIYKLEAGMRRPGSVTVEALAAVLCPHDSEALVEELRGLAGDSWRVGWRRAESPACRGLTVRQARLALDQATEDRRLAARLARYRPTAPFKRRLEAAEKALETAKLNMQRAEALSGIPARVNTKRGAAMSAD